MGPSKYKSHYNAEGLTKEVTNTDLSWLTAMIEAEGSISAGVGFRNTGNLVIYPLVTFTNKDQLVLNSVFTILDDLGISYKEAWRPSGGCCNVVISKMQEAYNLLTHILPFMKSSKQHNAMVVLDFIKDRQDNLLTRSSDGRVIRNKYTKQQVTNISAIRTHHSAHNIDKMLAAPNVQ